MYCCIAVLTVLLYCQGSGSIGGVMCLARPKDAWLAPFPVKEIISMTGKRSTTRSASASKGKWAHGHETDTGRLQRVATVRWAHGHTAHQVPPPVETAREIDVAHGPDRATRQPPAGPAPFGRASVETVGCRLGVPLPASRLPMGGRTQRCAAPRVAGTRDAPSGAAIAWYTTRIAAVSASGSQETKQGARRRAHHSSHHLCMTAGKSATSCY